VVLLFGAPKLPGMARAVGQSMKIFKSEVKDLTKDDEVKPTTETKPAASTGTTDSGTSPSSTSSTNASGSSPS
jgi:sec-independent protein translocase protein TatA